LKINNLNMAKKAMKKAAVKKMVKTVKGKK
jgi:hypothetical protein